MANQQYEYTAIRISIADQDPSNLASKLNDLAQDGWVLDERIDADGTTAGYVFRRPVE